MKTNRVVLSYDWERPLAYTAELSVPGVSGTISLIRECWCVEREYDESYQEPRFHSAIKNCGDCSGTGIQITDNGHAILALLEIAKERT